MEKEFPYLKKGDQSYPMVDIELIGPKGSLKVKALVDSGATFSIFRKEIADYLGIPIKEGQGLYFQGIKGKITGYLHQVPVNINREKFDCIIAFSPDLEISLNILGRNNFFFPFLITFNEKAQKIILEKNQEN
ncbi:MAG: retropepsin-like aspartic protease [Thermodesulfobacteriota bacterium]|nr:MAG: retropepsin-like aspartic protease [Thermodesulfobacteriota bacterium]